MAEPPQSCDSQRGSRFLIQVSKTSPGQTLGGRRGQPSGWLLVEGMRSRTPCLGWNPSSTT